MLAILLGYGAVTFCSQLTAMTIYSFTSADEGRKRLIKYTMRGVYLVLIAAVAVPLLENTQDLLGSAVASATAPWVNFIPVFGWLTAAVTGVLAGNWILVAAGAGATVLFVLLMLVLVTRMHADFYEDVLQGHRGLLLRHHLQKGRPAARNGAKERQDRARRHRGRLRRVRLLL